MTRRRMSRFIGSAGLLLSLAGCMHPGYSMSEYYRDYPAPSFSVPRYYQSTIQRSDGTSRTYSTVINQYGDTITRTHETSR